MQDPQAGANNSQFALQKIYVQDISFEAPNSPDIFTKQDFVPDINLQLNVQTRELDESLKQAGGTHEVILNITVTAKNKADEKTAYIVEVKQAGIFTAVNFPQGDLDAMLRSYCPNILFPYARELVSNLVERGGFPQFLLAPINFDALYQQFLDKERSTEAPASTTQH